MTGTARTSTRGRRRPARRSRSDMDEAAEAVEPADSRRERRYERRYERRQERYDRRHRPSRRRYLARRWVAVLVVLAVLGLTYVIMFTPLVGVRTVDVLGTREISREAVAEAAAIEPGSPMVRLDTDEVARRVARLPRVAEVSVSRSFPSTVEIQVTERRPVAVVLDGDGDGVHLVDRTGMSYATVSARPAGLPVLKVIRVAPDDPSTHAAVTVLGAIPDQLRERVVELSARTPGDVQLKLANGRVIKWGDAQDNERKAAVLAPLLTRPGKTYDVATPDFPTVS
jgi:cell division protein FtsQ